MFEGEKTIIFWIGLIVLSFASIGLFSIVWFNAIDFYTPPIELQVPFIVGTVVFILVGLYMMKSGVQKKAEVPKGEKREENNGNLDEARRRLNDTQRQTLVESCNARISTHINAIVAIVFGSFAILTILKGMGFPPENDLVWYLILIEVVGFPIGILYCLSRSWFFSRIAEKVKDQDLQNMELIAVNEAHREMPRPVRAILTFRKSLHEERNLVLVMFLWILWIGVTYAVLNLQP